MKIFRIIKRFKVSLVMSLLAFLLLLAAGCDVNEELFDSVGVVNFYQTEEELNLALNDVYQTLWMDMWRDGQWITFSDITGGTLLGGGDPNGSGDRSGNNTPWNSFT